MTQEFDLPTRKGASPEFGQEPPQLQYTDLGSEEIRIALKTWSFSAFPNVTEHDTLISVPSSRALCLDESIPAAHNDAFMPGHNSREFCHLHEDGSFHTVVSTEVEKEIMRKGWGVRHMYFDRGVKEMLVYAPRDMEEIDVAKAIIMESYRYASGDTEFIQNKKST